MLRRLFRCPLFFFPTLFPVLFTTVVHLVIHPDKRFRLCRIALRFASQSRKQGITSSRTSSLPGKLSGGGECEVIRPIYPVRPISSPRSCQGVLSGRSVHFSTNAPLGICQGQLWEVIKGPIRPKFLGDNFPGGGQLCHHHHHHHKNKVNFSY